MFDFDEASYYWRMNKKHLGGGVFIYQCFKILPNGTKCKKMCTVGKDPSYCSRHRSKY